MRFRRRVAALTVGIAVLAVPVAACEQQRRDDRVSATTYQLTDLKQPR